MKSVEDLTAGQRMGFLLKDTVIYGIGGALNKAIALITVPLLARHFTVSQFGLIDLANFSVVLTVTLVVFGMDSAVARYFYDDASKSQRRKIISQALAFQLVIVSIVCPILLINVEFLAPHLGDIKSGHVILQLMILQVPFFLLINFSQSILKWTFKRWHFLFISVGSALFTMITIVAGIAFFDIGLTAIFVLYLTTRAVFGMLGLWFVKDWLIVPYSFEYLRKMLPFAAPLGFICIATAFMPVIERRVVADILGAHELGLYAIGAKVAMLMALPVNAFEVAWGPFALAIHRSSTATESYRHVLVSFTILIFCCVLLLSSIATVTISLLASNQYAGAEVVVFPLAMVSACTAIGSVISIGITISRKTYLSLLSYLSLVACAVFMMPELSERFGISGVAWALLLATVIKVSLEAWLAQRAYPINWNLIPIIIPGMIALMSGFLNSVLGANLEVFGVASIHIMAIIFIIVNGWCFALTAADRKKVVSRLNQFRARNM